MPFTRPSLGVYYTVQVISPFLQQTDMRLSTPPTTNCGMGSRLPFSRRGPQPTPGRSLPAHGGAARLALLTGAPVIPIGIYFKRERARPFISKFGERTATGYWYLHGPYGITIGKPMQFIGNVADQPYIKSISETIMDVNNSLAKASQRRMQKA